MDLPIWGYVVLAIISLIVLGIFFFIIGMGASFLYLMYCDTMDFFCRLFGKPPFNADCSRASTGMYYFDEKGHCIGKWADGYHTKLIRYDE